MILPLIVCMGVSGCGKSTCGQLLAPSFNLTFVDADDLHNAHNIAKMRSGKPLTDADREPWMRDVCQTIDAVAKSGVGCVLAHSALRREHREQIRRRGLRTLFLHLEAPRETIVRRLSQREGHFMSTDLLDSQFEALETTHGEGDVIALDTALDRAELMSAASKLVDSFIAETGQHAVLDPG